jgi:hypothetical protein
MATRTARVVSPRVSRGAVPSLVLDSEALPRSSWRSGIKVRPFLLAASSGGGVAFLAACPERPGDGRIVRAGVSQAIRGTRRGSSGPVLRWREAQARLGVLARQRGRPPPWPWFPLGPSDSMQRAQYLSTGRRQAWPSETTEEQFLCSTLVGCA